MAIQKLDISAAGNLIKAIEYSAQQCVAPLSAWITHCCCAATPAQNLDGLPNRKTKPATRPTTRVTLDDVRKAGERSRRKTISCPECYSSTWSTMADICGQSVSSWVVGCCLPYLAHEVRELIPQLDCKKCDDNTSRLEFRLFQLFTFLDHSDSKCCLLTEFEPMNTHLFSHLPKLPMPLIEELDQLVDRMLLLAKTGDENPLGDGEVDTKLRFYFRASKRKLHRSEEDRQRARNRLAQLAEVAAKLNLGQESTTPYRKIKPRVYISNLSLFQNERLDIEQKLERLRASEILYRLKAQAIEGMSREQCLNELHGQDPFLRYVRSNLDYEHGTVYEILKDLSAFRYFNSLDYGDSMDSDDEGW